MSFRVLLARAEQGCKEWRDGQAVIWSTNLELAVAGVPHCLAGVQQMKNIFGGTWFRAEVREANAMWPVCRPRLSRKTRKTKNRKICRAKRTFHLSGYCFPLFYTFSVQF